MVIDSVQGLFVGVDEAQPTESQLGSWRCYNLIWCEYSLKVDKLLYRWINIWLNVVEHVLIKHTGMMSWLLPAVELKKHNTMQYEINVHHINRSVIMCNEWCWLVWLILAVCAATSFSSVKMSFAACHYNAVLSNPIKVQPHLTRSNKACGAAGRVIHLIWCNGGMTLKIISTFRLRLAQPAIATWARKRSPRLESSTPYCSLVVSTPDVHR